MVQVLSSWLWLPVCWSFVFRFLSCPRVCLFLLERQPRTGRSQVFYSVFATENLQMLCIRELADAVHHGERHFATHVPVAFASQKCSGTYLIRSSDVWAVYSSILVRSIRDSSIKQRLHLYFLCPGCGMGISFSSLAISLCATHSFLLSSTALL